MPWIDVIEEDQATGDLADYYREAREQGRLVANVRKVVTLNPQAMRAFDLLGASFRDGALSPRHREMVAVVTSAANRCFY